MTAELQRRAWRNDPCAYARDRLGLTLWPKLEAILNSVRDNPQTAVQSANGIGKTTLAALLVLWWMETRNEAIAFTTGSNWNSLTNVLWPRIHAMAKGKGILPNAAHLDMSLKVSPERYAFARSTNEPEGIQGIHSPNLLQVVEESSGIEPKIAEAIAGNASGANDRRVYLGNPLIPSGPFYDWCHSPQVNVITVSALEHPNVVTGENLIPGAISRRQVESLCEEWGRIVEPGTGNCLLPWMSREYLLDHRGVPRLLGRFPSAAVTSLISRDALMAAVARSESE